MDLQLDFYMEMGKSSMTLVNMGDSKLKSKQIKKT